MATKQLPTDKTLVFEHNLILADQFTRNRMMTDSIAARISQAMGVRTGDATVSQVSPIELENIGKVIYLNAWGPLALTLQYSDSVISEVPCSGLFVLFGSLDKVTIFGAQLDPIRLRYVYA